MGYSIIPSSAEFPANNKIIAENSYRILQNGSFENGKNIFTDEMTDSTGANNTVNTGDSTATFSTDKYECSATQLDLSGASLSGGFSDGANFFDNNYSTYARKTGDNNYNTLNLYATFTIPQGSQDLKQIKCKTWFNSTKGNTSAANTYFQVYRNSAWETVHTIASVSGTGSKTMTGTMDELVDLTGVTQCRVWFSCPSCDVYDARPYAVELFAGYANSTVVCDSNTITFNDTENTLTIFGDVDLPTNTEITYDISDGTTSVTGCELGEDIDISSLSSGTAKVTFNLNTTDDSATPALYGYGAIVIR